MPSRDFCTSPHQSPNVTPFLRVRPWKLVHVFSVPLPSLLHMFFFFFFSPKMWGSLRPKYPKKIQKPKCLADKNKKQKNIRWRLGRGTLNACAKFQGLNSQKRRGHWHLNEFGILFLNQPVRCTGRYRFHFLLVGRCAFRFLGCIGFKTSTTGGLVGLFFNNGTKQRHRIFFPPCVATASECFRKGALYRVPNNTLYLIHFYTRVVSVRRSSGWLPGAP